MTTGAQTDNRIICPACRLPLEAASACGTGCAPTGAGGTTSGAGCTTSGGGCAMLCCPHCGTTIPDPRKAGLTFRLARWLLRGKEPAPTGAHPLTGKEHHD